MGTWQYEEMEEMYTWLGRWLKPWMAGVAAAALIATIAILLGSQGT